MELKYGGKTYKDQPAAVMLAGGVPLEVITDQARSNALKRLTAQMNSFRDLAASSCPGKLFAYLFKARASLEPGEMSPRFMELLEREASARNMERADLTALIPLKHLEMQEIAQLIEALEAEGKAAIAAVPAAASDFEAAVNEALVDFLATAKAEFDQAFAEINGG